MIYYHKLFQCSENCIDVSIYFNFYFNEFLEMDPADTSNIDDISVKEEITHTGPPLITKPKDLLVVPNIILQTNAQIISRRHSFEETFDELMETVGTKPLNLAVELTIQPCFQSVHTILWVHLIPQNFLYSPSFSLTAPTNVGLLGSSLHSKEPLFITSQTSLPSYSPQIDSRIIPATNSLIIIPIILAGQTTGLLQLSRSPEKPFSALDIRNAKLLSKKFQLYGSFLIPDFKAILTTAFSMPYPLRNHLPPLSETCLRIARSFSCRSAEVWFLRRSVYKFDSNGGPYEIECKSGQKIGRAHV